MKKTNRKQVIYGVVLLLVGLLLGFIIFGGSGRHEAAPVAAGQEVTYTCPMHPQIQQPEFGACPICGMDLVAMDVTTDPDADPTVLQMTRSAVALANIQTTTVGIRSPEKEIRLPGRIEVDERQVRLVTAQFPGRIERLYVDFTGQEVRAGQRIASIYSPELIAAQRELFEAARFRETQPELYRAVRSRLQLWNLSEAQINAIERSGEVQPVVDIHARISGTVTERMVSPGDYVMEGEPLLRLADLGNLWVLFDAYQQDMPWIRQGADVHFTTEAAPGRTFTATVTFVDALLDPQTRTASVRAEVRGGEGLLRPGMMVQGRILSILPGRAPSIAVPKTAVLWTGERSVVYLKLTEMDVPSFRMQEVVLGPSLNGFYIIEQGLNAGDQIVVNGVFTIDAQAQLNNRRSMMNRHVRIEGTPDDRPAARVVPDLEEDVPPAFERQWLRVINRYLGVKDALVMDDPELAANRAETALITVQGVDDRQLRGESRDLWLEQQLGLEAHLEGIMAATDLEEQRQEFHFLSTAMITLTEAFGNPGPQLYLQYCPMADGDQGAYWLSREEIIANPYFGDSMLRCGEIRGMYPDPEGVFEMEEVVPAGGF